jgi:phosphatidylglycerol:prolipoprotein diacylglycerol transferase
MYPYVYVLGKDFAVFGIMAVFGTGVGTALAVWLCDRKGVNRTDALLTACMTIVGAMVGAWLLGPLIKLPDVLVNWEHYKEVPLGVFLSWFTGGIVFYGGVIGGALAAFLFCRSFKIPFLPIADIAAAALPLGHAFGRVGCFFGGCCYGVEVSASHLFAVVYPPRYDGLESLSAPAGVSLLAVPLIEAADNIIIFAIILCFLFFTRKNAVPGRALALYGLLYGTQRFVLEFFRGDMLRGVYGGVSTSQYISIGIIVLSSVLVMSTFRKAEKHCAKSTPLDD